MYDKSYYDQRKQELQQENFRNILDVYDDILRLMQRSVAKTQEINKKFQELELKEKESQKEKKKPQKEAPNDCPTA